jgi:hypothetical protein
MLKVNLLSLFIFIFNENFLVESKKLLFTNSLNDFDNIDIECPENCLNQKCNNETLKCIECIDGYYSDKCDKECPIDHCIKCKQDDGECIDCDSNYHLVYNYCCDTNCNLCDVNGCLDCASKEKYGEECVDCPNTCDDNGDQRKCDQSTGKCFKCKMGKRGDYCTDNCNLGCDISEINCAKEDGKCDCKMVILEKHAMKNAIKIVKIVIRMMVHVMNANQNIILTQMIKSNVLNVLRIAMGNVLWEYVKNVFLVYLVIPVRKLVLKIV